MRIEIDARERLLLSNVADHGLSLQGRVEKCQAVGSFDEEDLLDMARSAESAINNLLLLQEILKAAVKKKQEVRGE